MKSMNEPVGSPIAIIGISCLLPDADTPEQYWHNLIHGVDSVRPATEIEWKSDPTSFLKDGKGILDAASSISGGWRQDISCDKNVFQHKSVSELDREFRWTLHCSSSALKDAGIGESNDLRERCANIIAAYSWSPTFSSHEFFLPLYLKKLQSLLGSSPELAEAIGSFSTKEVKAENACIAGMLASITSDSLGLGGPTYSIDAACASSLYSLKLAALHLRSRQCDVAVVSGISAGHPVFATLGFSAMQALPQNSPSRPLDAASDGLAPAEGCVTFVVQRLHDARHQGRKIYGVIRGIGLSNDGRGRHLLVPQSSGQQIACRRALTEAGIDAGSIDYIDCHGTGTSVGDKTELETLAELYPENQFPLIGSAKSNLGHLLTAAGLVSALKIVLSMQAGRHAPTIGINTPLRIDGRPDISEKIVRASIPWSMRGTTRRGAVNSFGFGGTNGQLIIDQFPSDDMTCHDTLDPVPMLVTGMACRFGTCRDLSEVQRHAFIATPVVSSVPEDRWNGLKPRGFGNQPCSSMANSIVEIDLDALRYQLLPDSIEKMNPQQLLILDVADRALQDSGIERGGHIAVVIAHAEDLIVHRLQMRWQVDTLLKDALRATGLSLSPSQYEEVVTMLKEAMHPLAGSVEFASYIGNLMASRIASLWDFSGPAFSLSAQESSTVRGLEVARLFLASGEADAVLLGVVDMAAHAENVMVRHLLTSAGRRDPLPPCDGAGAIVLCKKSSKPGNKFYATIESEAVSRPRSGLSGGEQRRSTFESACTKAGIQASDISLLQTDEPKEAITHASKEFTASESSSVCLANSSELFGDAHAASQMLDLILAISALSGRCLPPAGKTREWFPLPKPFYTTETAIPWTRQNSRPRIATVQSLDSTGTMSCIVLSDRHRPPSPMRIVAPPYSGRHVAVIQGVSASELIQGLSEFFSELTNKDDLEEISRRSLTQLDSETGRQRVVLCASTPEAMRQEIEGVRNHLRSAPDRLWHTHGGSWFTPDPLGGKGKVAFLYPPFNTPYPGMQPDLTTMFPYGMDRIEEIFINSEAAMAARMIFPRLAQPLRPADKEAHDKELRQSTFALFRAGVSHSVTSTIAVRDVLGIRPDYALGYSLGELSMLIALGVWSVTPEWIERVIRSGFLESGIGGQHLLARRYYGVGDSDNFEWASRVVLVNADYANKKLHGMDKVFVSQASTRNESVISGPEPDVTHACALLGGDVLRMENSLAVHCPVVQDIVPQLVSLLSLEPQACKGIRFCFSSGDSPGNWTAQEVAKCVANGVSRFLNFPKMIDDIYGDGARIFLEVGAQNTCTRRISSILKGKPHLAIATDTRGIRVQDSYAMLMSACLAHQVPINLEAWINMLSSRRTYGLQITKSVARVHPVTLTALQQVAKDIPEGDTISSGGGDEALVASAEHMTWLKKHRIFLMKRSQIPQIAGQTSTCLFDEADVMEFAEGKLSRMFGPEYAEFDKLPQRMRVPSPPFLAISRIISINAKRFVLETCSIVTEFDIPPRYWGRVGDHASFMAADAQGVLFLLGYIGIDRWLEGKRTYRWLDAKMKFTGISLPIGSTVRYEIRIRSFTRHGQILLFVTDFDCDVNGRRFLEIRDCTAGFFTDEELAKGQGLLDRDTVRAVTTTTYRVPLSSKRTLTETDLTEWQRGNMVKCFGRSHADIENYNPLLKLVSGPMRFIDRIVSLRPPSEDGAHLVAEKWLDPGDWYLRSHFKDTPVFAGPCMVEGCFQALQCYAIYLGLPDELRASRFSPADDSCMEVKFRGQVPAEHGSFFMRLHITDIQYGNSPSLYADFDLVYKERIIGRVANMGIKIQGTSLKRL